MAYSALSATTALLFTFTFGHTATAAPAFPIPVEHEISTARRSVLAAGEETSRLLRTKKYGVEGLQRLFGKGQSAAEVLAKDKLGEIESLLKRGDIDSARNYPITLKTDLADLFYNVESAELKMRVSMDRQGVLLTGIQNREADLRADKAIGESAKVQEKLTKEIAGLREAYEAAKAEYKEAARVFADNIDVYLPIQMRFLHLLRQGVSHEFKDEKEQVRYSTLARLIQGLGIEDIRVRDEMERSDLAFENVLRKTLGTQIQDEKLPEALSMSRISEQLQKVSAEHRTTGRVERENLEKEGKTRTQWRDVRDLDTGWFNQDALRQRQKDSLVQLDNLEAQVRGEGVRAIKKAILSMDAQLLLYALHTTKVPFVKSLFNNKLANPLIEKLIESKRLADQKMRWGYRLVDLELNQARLSEKEIANRVLALSTSATPQERATSAHLEYLARRTDLKDLFERVSAQILADPTLADYHSKLNELATARLKKEFDWIDPTEGQSPISFIMTWAGVAMAVQMGPEAIDAIANATQQLGSVFGQ